MDEERNLLDYAYVVVKWRRLIVASVLAVSLAAAGVSLLLPKRWTAETRLLPPEEEIDQLGLSALAASAVPGNLGRLMGGVTPGKRLVAILGSKRVLGAIVDRFGLIQEYGVSSRDLAIQFLDENVERELGQDGTLTVKVTASSPELAAAIANALTAELDSVNREGKRYQATALRRFLEERVQVVQQEVEASGRALQRFKELHGLVDLYAQTAAVVEVVKSTIQELTLLEVKLGVARQQLTLEHEQRQELEMEVNELRRQLQRLTGKLQEQKSEEVEETLRILGPALKEIPALGLEYTQLALDFGIKEQILSFLGNKLEEAKYKEAQNTPTIQVLDPATPPEFRSAPRRKLIVAVAAAVSLMTSVVLAFVLESLGQLKAENRKKLEAIRGQLRSSRQDEERRS